MAKKAMDYETFYAALFRELESKYGPLDSETVTSIVGFSAGGPVSLSKLERKKLFVTCELSVYPEQRKSKENLNFELLAIDDFSEDWCRKVFTALGNLSMNSVLGNNHTIDISGVVEKSSVAKKVQLKLFSKTKYENKNYGIYRVVPC
jgi:hypothetical protein